MQTAFALPSRQGAPPQVTDGIPHIQLDQTASDEMIAELSAWAFSLDGVVEQPTQASIPGTRALTLAADLPAAWTREFGPRIVPPSTPMGAAPGGSIRIARAEAMIVDREFAHIHAQPNGGGSLHLRIPIDQAETVVDKGWGEWHPFAVDGTMPGLVMVYAPRSDEDLEAVKTIIESAVAYAATGLDSG